MIQTLPVMERTGESWSMQELVVNEEEVNLGGVCEMMLLIGPGVTKVSAHSTFNAIYLANSNILLNLSTVNK